MSVVLSFVLITKLSLLLTGIPIRLLAHLSVSSISLSLSLKRVFFRTWVFSCPFAFFLSFVFLFSSFAWWIFFAWAPQLQTLGWRTVQFAQEFWAPRMTSDSSGIYDSQATQGQFFLSLSPPFLASVHLSWIYQHAVEWEEYLCDGKFATCFFSQATSWFLPKKGMQKKKRSRRRGFYDSQHDEENIWVDGFYGGNRWVCCCANREQFAKHKFKKGIMSWLLDSCVKRWIWVRGCGYAYGRPKT